MKEDLRVLLKREVRDLITFASIAEEFGGGKGKGTFHPRTGHICWWYLGITTIKQSQQEDAFCGMCVVSY